MDNSTIAKLTADIATAYVGNIKCLPADVVELVEGVSTALAQIGEEKVEGPARTPAVDPAKSVKRDAIISLIDGKPYKMLKRHLATHGMTPDEYREAFGLPSDYPMVARSYSEKRSALAKESGLGRAA